MLNDNILQYLNVLKTFFASKEHSFSWKPSFSIAHNAIRIKNIDSWEIKKMGKASIGYHNAFFTAKRKLVDQERFEETADPSGKGEEEKWFGKSGGEKIVNILVYLHLLEPE